jgi:hypothetical protein
MLLYKIDSTCVACSFGCLKHIFHIQAKLVRLAIKTPDQKLVLVTPMPSHFFKKDATCRRLLTNAIMSHQVSFSIVSLMLGCFGFG